MSTAPALTPDELAARKVAEGDFELAGDRATAEHGEHHGFAHVSPISTLLAVFFALVVLTVITWAVALVETGSAEIYIAMLIATIKAGLVATWFMHLRYDKPLNAMLFCFSTLFLALFLVLTISDASQYASQISVPDYPQEPVEVEEIADEQAADVPVADDSMEGRPE